MSVESADGVPIEIGSVVWLRDDLSSIRSTEFVRKTVVSVLERYDGSRALLTFDDEQCRFAFCVYSSKRAAMNAYKDDLEQELARIAAALAEEP